MCGNNCFEHLIFLFYPDILPILRTDFLLCEWAVILILDKCSCRSSGKCYVIKEALRKETEAEQSGKDRHSIDNYYCSLGDLLSKSALSAHPTTD